MIKHIIAQVGLLVIFAAVCKFIAWDGSIGDWPPVGRFMVALVWAFCATTVPILVSEFWRGQK
jgi:hypothetical protein